MLERITNFTPAFDKRSSDPKKDYGIHGVNLQMVVKGPLGAVNFTLYTNWNLPHVYEELKQKALRNGLGYIDVFFKPMPADLGYHSLTPHYEGHTSMKCDLVEGGRCYYDGSTLNAEPIYDLLVKKGSDAVWERLEEYYNQVFAPKPKK